MKHRIDSNGVHFFDRVTGTNVLLDEYQPPRRIWSSGPRFVSVALTNSCDLRCRYCYAPKIPAIIDRNRLIEWLQELDRLGTMGVGFGGGEPTLYPEFPTLCNEVATKTGLAVSFTTHAHHISRSLISQLERNVHFVRVSMDGVESTYNTLRHRSFDKLIQSIDLLSELAPFGINFVVNSTTFPDLNAAVELAKDKKAVELLLLPEQPVDGKNGIDPVTKVALIDWIRNYKGEIPLAISDVGAEGLPMSDQFCLGHGLSSYAHIDASSRIRVNSFHDIGVPIEPLGIVSAIKQLERLLEGSN